MQIRVGNKDIGRRFDVVEEVARNKGPPDVVVDNDRVGPENGDAGWARHVALLTTHYGIMGLS